MIWLLHLLPLGFTEFVVNMTLTIGVLCAVAGFLLLRFVPFVNLYKMYFQIAAVILLSIGLFWKGCLITEADWRKKVDILNVKLKAAETKSKEVNIVIKERVVTKIKVVKAIEYRNKEIIKYKEAEIDKNCTVPKVAVDILNNAATNPNKSIEKVSE